MAFLRATFALALAAALATAALAQDRADGAFLVLARRMSGALVEGKNVTVDYEIRNVGTA